MKEAQAKHNFGDKGYLAFEHITWVNISKRSLWLLLNADVLIEN